MDVLVRQIVLQERVILNTGFFTEESGGDVKEERQEGVKRRYFPKSAKAWVDLNDFNSRPKSLSFQKCLSVLVHEILHAFFDIYSCKCRDCHDENADPFQGGLATLYTGHGPAPAWADTMSA